MPLGRTSGRETCKVACDGRGVKGEMVSHAQGATGRRECEESCLDGPLSDVGKKGDVLCRLLCSILDPVSNYIDCEPWIPTLNS